MRDNFLLLIMFACVCGILFLIGYSRLNNQEEQKFMEYCQKKGNSEEDCKWEWKRLENGQKSDLIMITR